VLFDACTHSAAHRYKALAIAFVSGDAHRKVSLALLAKDLGARVPQRRVASVRMSFGLRRSLSSSE
jgi:hypothetical protein